MNNKDDSYDCGYEDGHKEGYESGYSNGWEDAKQELIRCMHLVELGEVSNE